MTKASRLLALCEDIELDDTKKKVDQVHKQISNIQYQLKRERDSGKDPNILQNLQAKIKDLRDKIADYWKQYDSKHGTSYAKVYSRA